MAKMETDAIGASFVVGLARAFMLVGIATFNLFDMGFGETLFSVAGIDISTTWVLGYASIVGTIFTNENTELATLSDDIQSLQGYYALAAGGTLLPVAFVVFPRVSDFFMSADLWRLVYTVVDVVDSLNGATIRELQHEHNREYRTGESSSNRTP